MNYLIGQHGELYQEVVAGLNSDGILQVFDMMKIENFGRAMAFLTLVYMLEGSEDQIRSSVRLVAPVFKKFGVTPYRIERGFIQRIGQYFRQMITNIRQYF